MMMFTFAFPCVTTSNLPWFVDLTFQVPMQYCSLQHQTISITTHIHSCVLFLLWLCLFILSGVISLLFFSSILGTYQPGVFIFQRPIFLPFHTVHEVLKASSLKWFAIPLFGQSYASSVGSIVVLMATSSKRTYAVLRSAAPRAPAPGHCWPVPPQEKGAANHFSILALRTLWTVLKGKKVGHWKMNSPGQ